MLARLRPWLAPLLAVSANSPIAGRRDTGWASWRYVIQGTLADRDPARGVAGRGRLRHGSPPPDRARGGAGRAERLLPGPAVPALPDRRGPGRRRLPRRRHRGAAGGADPRPGRHRPGRGPPRDAGASRAGPAGRRGPGRRGAARARRGSSRPGHRAARRCPQPPVPPARSCLPRAQGPRRHRDDHHAAAPGSTSKGPEPTASEPCSPAPPPRPRSSPHSPAPPCPATSQAAGTGPMPGSRQRQARNRGRRKSSTGSSAPTCSTGSQGQWCCASSSSTSGRRSPRSAQPSVQPSRATISPRDINSPGRRHGCADPGAFGSACPRATPV